MFAPAVVTGLAEALRHTYWYKKDLRSFLLRAGVPHAFVGRLDWDANKRDIIREMLDELVRQPTGTAIVSKVIDAVVEMDDFSHLERLDDDGARKAADASAAVTKLKNLLGKTSVAERADRARAEKRTEAERRKVEHGRLQNEMLDLKSEFEALSNTKDVQARGLAFEPFLRRLFALHDLDPRGSFSLPGEQTDGSIRLDSQLFLVDARWRAEPESPADVRSFRGKVEEKLDNTLGIMISMNGFTEEAIKRAAVPPAKLILVDGQDLAPVVQGLVDFVKLLQRKVRRAAETGEVLVRV